MAPGIWAATRRTLGPMRGSPIARRMWSSASRRRLRLRYINGSTLAKRSGRRQCSNNRDTLASSAESTAVSPTIMTFTTCSIPVSCSTAWTRPESAPISWLTAEWAL
ncbi:hypothetical protein ACFFX0_09550 [Citricoccus parietis]|uniref:Uncharacterized protein n=1 Tax=Citricoccus parietis TaxID=592307 RepID=A0ABV5FXL2_9MICC